MIDVPKKITAEKNEEQAAMRKAKDTIKVANEKQKSSRNKSEGNAMGQHYATSISKNDDDKINYTVSNGEAERRRDMIGDGERQRRKIESGTKECDQGL